jgi:hypothetical protein
LYDVVMHVEENLSAWIEDPGSLVDLAGESLATPNNKNAAPVQEEASVTGAVKTVSSTRSKKRDKGTDEVAKLGLEMQRDFEKIKLNSDPYKRMLESRMKLPSYGYRTQIINVFISSFPSLRILTYMNLLGCI